MMLVTLIVKLKWYCAALRGAGLTLAQSYLSACTALLVGLMLFTTGCVSPSEPHLTRRPIEAMVASSTIAEPTLYQALGGKAGISAIVDVLLAKIAQDGRIVHYFEELDIALFRERVIEHLCVVTEGDCVYQGEDMLTSHQGLNITQRDFDALVDHLIAAMQAQQVAIATRNALLKRLAPLYEDITYQ